MPWHGGGGWWWWPMGFLMSLFWLVVVIVLIWFFARVVPTRPLGRSDPDSPENILKRRYARGEIDKEEYDRRLSDLRR